MSETYSCGESDGYEDITEFYASGYHQNDFVVFKIVKTENGWKQRWHHGPEHLKHALNRDYISNETSEIVMEWMHIDLKRMRVHRNLSINSM